MSKKGLSVKEFCLGCNISIEDFFNIFDDGDILNPTVVYKIADFINLPVTALLRIGVKGLLD